MVQAVEYVSFSLRKGVIQSDFILASDKMNQDFLSAQKGYVGRKLLNDGDTWADMVLWETMSDAQHAAEVCNENSAASEYFLYIENVDFHDFSIIKEFNRNGGDSL